MKLVLFFIIYFLRFLKFIFTKAFLRFLSSNSSISYLSLTIIVFFFILVLLFIKVLKLYFPLFLLPFISLSVNKRSNFYLV